VIPDLVSIQPEEPPVAAFTTASEPVSAKTSQSKGKVKKKSKSSRRKPHNDDHETSYRHLPIGLKRKSFESMSVG
jgi:hypothetical protein